MKKIITITTIILICNATYAQFSIGIGAGYNLNYLRTDISNRLFIRNTSKIGYCSTLLLNYYISTKLNLQTGINLIQKNYSFVRTEYYDGIYDTFNNTYLQVPVLAQTCILKKNKIKALLNTGFFASVWTSAKAEGTIPNMFDSTNLIDEDGQVVQHFRFQKYSEVYKFNTTKDNRIEFGLILGSSINLELTQKYSIFLESNYYCSLTDLQNRYMANQTTKNNRTTSFSIGCIMKL